MPVVGDFKALNELIGNLRAIAGTGADSDEFKRGLFTVCAAAAQDALDNQFIKSIDPYGKKWKPLVHPSQRRGGASAKPLLDTGRLSTSFSRHITDDGFVIETNLAYAPVHQYGAFIPPHTKLYRALAFDKNGRFISVRTAKGRKKADRYWLGHVTYGKGIRIPQRQMIPMEETGGIGDAWGKGINEAAEQFVKDWIGLET